MPGYRELHPWDVSATEAAAIQTRLRPQVRVEPLDVAALRSVGGADISLDRGADIAYAGVVTLSLPDLQAQERSGVEFAVTFPYVPGLLSFRETPAVLAAWAGLAQAPEALVCDGHGYAHPRRFGYACHVGLLLDVPTVGCAKSILVGAHEPVGPEVGDWAPLVHRGEVVGAALRTKPNVTPVYVSVGHRCDLPSAIALVLRCGGKTRVPETTRLAHLFVNELRRTAGMEG